MYVCIHVDAHNICSYHNMLSRWLHFDFIKIFSFNPWISIDHTIPVEGLHCAPGSMRLLSYSSRQLKAWTVQQLYVQTALTGNKVNFLNSSTHPMVPLRILASCADSAVRLISPVGGQVITTALLPIGRVPLSLVYFSYQGTCIHVYTIESLTVLCQTVM